MYCACLYKAAGEGFLDEDETESFRLPSIHVWHPVVQSDGSPPFAPNYASFLLEKGQSSKTLDTEAPTWGTPPPFAKQFSTNQNNVLQELEKRCIKRADFQIFS